MGSVSFYQLGDQCQTPDWIWPTLPYDPAAVLRFRGEAIGLRSFES